MQVQRPGAPESKARATVKEDAQVWRLRVLEQYVRARALLRYPGPLMAPSWTGHRAGGLQRSVPAAAFNPTPGQHPRWDEGAEARPLLEPGHSSGQGSGLPGRGVGVPLRPQCDVLALSQPRFLLLPGPPGPGLAPHPPAVQAEGPGMVPQRHLLAAPAPPALGPVADPPREPDLSISLARGEAAGLGQGSPPSHPSLPQADPEPLKGQHRSSPQRPHPHTLARGPPATVVPGTLPAS